MLQINQHVILTWTATRACWDKNKSICSPSSSQLSGQICQIVFVMLMLLAVRICHCAEVWFLPDSMQLSLVVCTVRSSRTALFWLHPFPPPLSSRGWGKCLNSAERTALAGAKWLPLFCWHILLKHRTSHYTHATNSKQLSPTWSRHTQTRSDSALKTRLTKTRLSLLDIRAESWHLWELLLTASVGWIKL